MSATFVRPLAELRRGDAAEFGGKSANLGDLIAGGIPVPDGFAVGAPAFRAFVEATGLEGTIAAALAKAQAGDVESVGAASKTIGEAMRFAPLPDDVRGEVHAWYGELARATGDEGPPVAVRSSALGEDGEDASHAGQQESFLWVRGVDHVSDAVRDCWASLYTPQAISYRAALRTPPAETAMGVTVQLMVDAEVSGVLFTCNPVSGDPSMVAVNASWGLGVVVVGGEVTPDDYLVSKVTGEVVRRTVSSKAVEYVPDATGRGAVRMPVPAERRDAPCLDDGRLARLVEVAKLVEGHFGSHQDVEWAIGRDGVLRVLQARPVTTLPQARPALSGSALSLVLATFGAPPKDTEPS